MKTSAARKGKFTVSKRFQGALLSKQHGMGATIILFTIALIVLVGAALAYASRNNPRALDTQGAKVFAGVLLKQSADYRDGYSRYIFDGGLPSAMTFNTNLSSADDLFNPSKQLASYQQPPQQATTIVAPSSPVWLYNASAVLEGVGTAAGDSIAYVPDVTWAVCEQVNNQMYGTIAIPTVAIADKTAAGAGGAVFTTTPSIPGRASSCVQLNGGAANSPYLFYSTLGEA